MRLDDLDPASNVEDLGRGGGGGGGLNLLGFLPLLLGRGLGCGTIGILAIVAVAFLMFSGGGGLLTGGQAPEGWTALRAPNAICGLDDAQYLFVEGGANTAEAFLAAGLVDRLLLYRSPTEFGEGIPAFRDPGPQGVPRGWRLADRRALGSDTLEVYYPGEPEGA